MTRIILLFISSGIQKKSSLYLISLYLKFTITVHKKNCCDSKSHENQLNVIFRKMQTLGYLTRKNSTANFRCCSFIITNVCRITKLRLQSGQTNANRSTKRFVSFAVRRSSNYRPDKHIYACITMRHHYNFHLNNHRYSYFISTIRNKRLENCALSRSSTSQWK